MTMPLTLEDDLAILSDAVTVEEAEPLWQWLQRCPRGRVDLAAVTHVHTAVLQLLLAARPAVAVPFTDPFLATWISWWPAATAAEAEPPPAADAA